MKIKTLIILSTFLATNFLVFGYLSPLEDIPRRELIKAEKKRTEMKMIAGIEAEMNIERNPRTSDWFSEEEEAVDKRLIMYLDPAIGYGPRDNYELIEAIQYRYSDGSTKVITYDGEVLKNK